MLAAAAFAPFPQATGVLSSAPSNVSRPVLERHVPATPSDRAVALAEGGFCFVTVSRRANLSASLFKPRLLALCLCAAFR